MKNTIKIFAIIAMVAVIMIGMAACSKHEKTYSLKVVNNSSSPLSVNMRVNTIDTTWEGVLQINASKTITYTMMDMIGGQSMSYSVVYGIEGGTSRTKSGDIEENKTVTVTLTDADL